MTLYLPTIAFADDAVDSCGYYSRKYRHIMHALIGYTVDLTIPESTGPTERVVVVAVEADHDVVLAETDEAGARIPGGGTWAVPLNMIQKVTVQTRVSQAAALAVETTAEPEEEATHAVTLTLSLDPETEMGDNAPKTFHEAARLMLTVVDGPLPPGAIHPIRKAGRPDVTS